MKILYDYQIFYMQKFGGISRYFYELMRNSENLYEFEIPIRYTNNVFLKEMNINHSLLNEKQFKGKNFLESKINNINSRINNYWKNYDVFHPTYYDPYFKHNKPTVVTVYDMIHELFPQYFPNDNTINNKKEILKKADLIIAISESTKNDIIKFFPEINPEKIIITYLGNSFPITKKTSVNTSDYILFTGSRYGYKNFELFLKAVAPLLIKYNLKLICTGNDFSQEENGLFNYLGVLNNVIHVFADDKKLKDLYAGALLFVFPSLYEGFGIPVLEAFSSGCPLLVSETSSLAEISGNAGILFDPYSMIDIQEKIENVITSETLRKDMIKNGYEQLKKFSWKKCAEETSEVYRKCIEVYK